MLRLFAFVLLLLNLGYFVWSNDVIRGLGPVPQSEPQRLTQQVRPEAVRVLGVDETRRLEALVQAQGMSAGRGGQCLSIGLFDSREAAAVREALSSVLAPEAWEMEPGSLPARWVVYMGRYESSDILAKKRAELRGLNIAAEPIQIPALEHGLNLGTFETAIAANTALAELALKGVRTARVILERAETRGQMLRLPQADDRLRLQVDGIKAEGLKTALEGKTWQPCQIAAQAPAPFAPQTPQ